MPSKPRTRATWTLQLNGPGIIASLALRASDESAVTGRSRSASVYAAGLVMLPQDIRSGEKRPAIRDAAR